MEDRYDSYSSGRRLDPVLRQKAITTMTTTTTALEAVRAALASIETTITFTASERDDAQHGAVIVVENVALEGLDDAAAFEIQERDDRASAKALEAAGFEMVASGANGAPEGGCWSYWRAVESETTESEAVEIRYVESDTELHQQYRGQSAPQDVYVELDCVRGILRAAYNPEIGNAVTSDVANGHTQCWEIAPLKADAANALLDEIAPLAARVVAGYSSEWDGSNHVAEFDGDAEDAIETIEALCEKIRDRDDDSEKISVWQASDWFGGVGDYAAQRRALGIGANTTDDELDAILAREETIAEGDGIDVLEGASGHLKSLRDDARDEAPTDATVESGTERFEATLDRKAGEVSILRTELTESVEDENDVSQWPDHVSADRDIVRLAIESDLGVWIESLPSDGWSETEYHGETVAKVKLSAEQPSHRIVFRDARGVEHAYLVRLVDGVGYTHAERESQSAADWECSAKGEWRCQGQVTPGGAVGTVTVERV